MPMQGRPLRFLALVAVGWVGARITLLWPQTGSLPEAIKALVPLAGVSSAEAAPTMPIAAPRADARREAPLRRALPASATVTDAAPAAAAGAPLLRAPTTWLVAPETAAPAVIALPVAARPMLAPDRLDPAPNRWSASGWVAVRPGSGLGAAPGGGQLGGSQAGVRISYMLVPRHRVAVFTRLTAPLAGKGREAAIGAEWQPTRAPVRLVAEQRFGLDGTRGGPGIGIVTGLDLAVGGGFRLEAYGQAGAIRRARTEPYADGAARVMRGFAAPGGVRLALGGGVWSAAQRGAERLDAGPSATLAARGLRLSIDWRQRLAGGARPGSGLAVTLGGDF